MQVRCIHCSHMFDHVAPSFAPAGGSTRCPACGRETPAEDAWSLGGGEPGVVGGTDNQVYCFNCGKGMTPKEGELIPVCDECRAEQAAPGPQEEAAADEPPADWMIRKANGNVYGPFPTETIVEWIHARKISAGEEVAHIGGAWRLFGQHEEFGKYFEKPVDVPVGTTQDLDFRRKSPVKDALGRFGVLAAVLAIGGGVAFFVWYAVSNKALVIPEATIDKVADKVGGISGGEARRGTPMSPDARALLTELVGRYPSLEGSSMEHFLRGRTLMQRDNYDNLIKARTELEKAVVLDPSNALALSSLSELYNLLATTGYGSLDLQRQSIYLLQMAEATGNYPASVLRSKAAFEISAGNYAEGRRVANDALQKNPEDPTLHYLLGVAAMGGKDQVTPQVQTHFDKALELDPNLHQVWFALAEAEESAGELSRAVEFYGKKVAIDPQSSSSHARLGHIYRRVGDYDAARKHLDKAIALNPREKDAVLERAVVAYQVEGDPAKAVKLLQGMLGEDGPELKIAERKVAGTHLSAALRLTGKPQEALAAADEVLTSDRTHGPAHFQRGLALIAAGNPSDAMPAFAKAEDSRLDRGQLARVLFFTGYAALKADRAQEASEAFSRALDTDPGYAPLWVWQAHVNAMLGDPKAAAEKLQSSVKEDPLAYRRDRDLGEWWAPAPSPEPVAEAMKAALEKEAFAPNLAAAVGIAHFHAGQLDRAEPYLVTATEQDSRNVAGLFYRGLIASHAGRASEAVSLLRKALDVTSSGTMHVYLGDALLNAGQVDEAIESFERGLAYGGKSAWSLTRLADALAKAGRSDDAMKRLADAEQADPSAVLPRKALYKL